LHGRQVNPANTVIDGLGQTGAFFGLTVDGDANALVEGVTFTRLVGDSTVGHAFSLGLDADTSDVASTEVRYSRFTSSSASAIVYLEAAQMRFVNNVVSGNTTSGNRAAAVFADYSYNADSMLVASSNTIANNAGGPGLRVDALNDPSARVSEISDNILWHNGSVDLSLGNFDSANNALIVDYNTIGVATGYTPDASNLSFDPHFVNEAAGNYALASNSSAINSGALFQVWGFPRAISPAARASSAAVSTAVPMNRRLTTPRPRSSAPRPTTATTTRRSSDRCARRSRQPMPPRARTRSVSTSAAAARACCRSPRRCST
jgi:hypothetical protein